MTNRFAGIFHADLSAEELERVKELALKALTAKVRDGRVLKNPTDTRDYLCLKMAEYTNEVFGIVLLSTRNKVLGIRELFTGTINGTAVHPRVIVQHVLELNAAAVILFHNHPSGVAEQSASDELLTRKVQSALSTIDVRVLDHLIIAGGECLSFAERGMLGDTI